MATDPAVENGKRGSVVDTIRLQDIHMLARRESAKMHHFFIGVEHLFVALTQLKDGLTSTVLEYHGLSPRFVRYSIRETVGRYEDRRFWPGFPETPRAVRVAELAREYARGESPTERELLLAILDEADSIVIRVLNQMGANVMALRESAANWTLTAKARAPEVSIEDNGISLTDEQEQVLQRMFRDYGSIQIVRDMDDGHSPARVLLIRPVRIDGMLDAPVVVKLDDRHSILYERRRYDLHVKGSLPAATARLVDAPVVPDKLSTGGLKYTFVGRLEDSEPVSAREFARQRDVQDLSRLIRSLYDNFGPSWWRQATPYRFGVWREYEHVLPPALVIEAAPVGGADVAWRDLRPSGDWSRRDLIMPGELVVMHGFSVQKLNLEDDKIQLSAGAGPEAVNRSGKVEVRGLGADGATHFRGEVIERLAGRVISTRSDILLRQLQDLEPEFDIRQALIPSAHDMVDDLPNPLSRVTDLLERQVSGHLSSIHGDLHLGNILVGPGGDAWLIDFAWAREGHTLFDWALLEVSLLVDVVASVAPAGWEGAWGAVALLQSINQGEDRVLREQHRVGRLLTAVMTIRDIVRRCLAVPDRWTEYFVALALLSLRSMGWESVSLDGRRLAFLISALSIAEVENPSQDVYWTDVTTTDMDVTDLNLGARAAHFFDDDTSLGLDVDEFDDDDF